ncbi:MAG: glycosyltransferase family 39 protein [Bacteroidia bacterium]|nr:glycosyltransferase family 39 protein [Bacteroidia bacterium]
MRIASIVNTWLLKLGQARQSTIATFFFLLAFAIRFPFFFRDYIDRDESTFILLGQSLVDGHLPYMELWDLKPPLIYYFFGLLIYVFGKSFIAIRLAATVLVGLTAFLTFKIARPLSNSSLALLAGLFCIYLSSLFGSLQGLMSEHISTLIFVFALYLLLQSQQWWKLFLSGLLFGFALMAKMNLGYALAILVAYYIWQWIRSKPWEISIYILITLSLGILLGIGICALPYVAIGESALWVDAVFKAPLAYADASQGSFLKVLPLPLFTILFLFYAWKQNRLDLSNPRLQLVIILLFGIIFSFVRSGRINGHYLLQVYPLFLIVGAAFIFTFKLEITRSASLIIAIIMLILPIEAYKEYAHILVNKKTNGSWFNGEGFTVVEYIKNNDLAAASSLFLEYHIGYWLLDAKPPSKAATHPSNICRSETFPFYNQERKTGIEELTFIMDEKMPQIVVTRKNRSVFDKKYVQENEYIQQYLSQKYQVLDTIEGAVLHHRIRLP